jgi:hypothetical protein
LFEIATAAPEVVAQEQAAWEVTDAALHLVRRALTRSKICFGDRW